MKNGSDLQRRAASTQPFCVFFHCSILPALTAWLGNHVHRDLAAAARYQPSLPGANHTWAPNSPRFASNLLRANSFTNIHRASGIEQPAQISRHATPSRFHQWMGHKHEWPQKCFNDMFRLSSCLCFSNISQVFRFIFLGFAVYLWWCIGLFPKMCLILFTCFSQCLFSKRISNFLRFSLLCSAVPIFPHLYTQAFDIFWYSKSIEALKANSLAVHLFCWMQATDFEYLILNHAWVSLSCWWIQLVAVSLVYTSSFSSHFLATAPMTKHDQTTSNLTMPCTRVCLRFLPITDSSHLVTGRQAPKTDHYHSSRIILWTTCVTCVRRQITSPRAFSALFSEVFSVFAHEMRPEPERVGRLAAGCATVSEVDTRQGVVLNGSWIANEQQHPLFDAPGQRSPSSNPLQPEGTEMNKNHLVLRSSNKFLSKLAPLTKFRPARQHLVSHNAISPLAFWGVSTNSTRLGFTASIGEPTDSSCWENKKHNDMNKPIKRHKQTLIPASTRKESAPSWSFLTCPQAKLGQLHSLRNTWTSPSELLNMKLNKARQQKPVPLSWCNGDVLSPKLKSLDNAKVKILKLLHKVTNITKVTLPSQRTEIKSKFRSLLGQGSASFSNGFLPGEQVWWK